ncbi:hypothetical protein GE278_04245 [Enterobacteriaceae bacterium Kacie_13]|nr:hypothetical protein GE278_04245 [Enterobacteriaceae bacterium Kacie_13]
MSRSTYPQRKDAVLNALRQLFCEPSTTSEKAGKANTREIALQCDESIYSARSILLALAKEGQVSCTKQAHSRGLSWSYIPR